jgi:hypothetical protein
VAAIRMTTLASRPAAAAIDAIENHRWPRLIS